MTQLSKRDIVACSGIVLMFAGIFVLPSSRLGFIPIVAGTLTLLAMIATEWLPRS